MNTIAYTYRIMDLLGDDKASLYGATTDVKHYAVIGTFVDYVLTQYNNVK